MLNIHGDIAQRRVNRQAKQQAELFFAALAASKATSKNQKPLKLFYETLEKLDR